MHGVGTQQLESLEALAGSEETRDVVLRIARVARAGRLGTLVEAVRADPELDEATKRWVLELTGSERFLYLAELCLERRRDLS